MDEKTLPKSRLLDWWLRRQYEPYYAVFVKLFAVTLESQHALRPVGAYNWLEKELLLKKKVRKYSKGHCYRNDWRPGLGVIRVAGRRLFGGGCIATNTVILNQGVLLRGLFKGLRNTTVPYNKSSFVWSAKSQKLSQLELIGNTEML